MCPELGAAAGADSAGAPGAAAGDADARRIDPVFRSMVTDESHRPFHLRHDLRDVVPGVGPVDHGEHGVSVIEERLHGLERDELMRREPASAHHEDHPQALGPLRLEDIEGQGGAIGPAVDDIPGSGRGHRIGTEAGVAGDGCRPQEQGEEHRGKAAGEARGGHGLNL